MVVREDWEDNDKDSQYGAFIFGAVIGVYWSINRAEEIAGASAQALRDAHVPEELFRFTVKASNYYDE